MMMNSSNGLNTSCDRSSSQISIYNYPDHLNPFHDEDHHKRLRFWHFSKRNDNNRRRSFSIENLRDVWNLRSFTLKKKSSTLGIQKTSESPPMLRRNLDTANNRRGLIQSLQNVNTPLGMESSKINSSPNYRSSARYYRCLTPQLQQNRAIRSSYSSLSSTNPFETDIESDDNFGGNATDAVVKKSLRKKRKAPLPPVRNMNTKLSSEPLQEKSKDACQPPIEVEPNIDIKSLTVEIERFVNQENEIPINKSPALESSLELKERRTEAVDVSSECARSDIPIKKSLTLEEPKDRHTDAADVSLDCTRNEIPISKSPTLDSSMESNAQHTDSLDVSLQSTSEKPNNIISNQGHVIIDEEKEISKEEITIPNIEYISRCDQVDKKQQVDKVNSHLIKSTENGYQNCKITKATEYRNQNYNIIKTTEHSNQSKRNTLANNSVEQITIPNIVYLSTEEQVDKKLQVDRVNCNATEHISQSHNVTKASENISQNRNVTKASENSQNRNVTKATESSSHSNYNALRKNSFYENNNIVDDSDYLNQPLTILEKTENKIDGSEDKSKTPKAKSVKEIIDSINRSQQLLKESAAKGTHVYSTSLYLKNNTSPLAADQNENSDEVCTNISNGSSCTESQSQMQQNYFQKSKINKEVFQCRESSPTASNLDWNPLPKPKRINSDSTT